MAAATAPATVAHDDGAHLTETEHLERRSFKGTVGTTRQFQFVQLEVVLLVLFGVLYIYFPIPVRL